LVIEEIFKSWYDFPTYLCECDRCAAEFETADEFKTRFCSADCATKHNQRMSAVGDKLKAEGKKVLNPAFKYIDNYVKRRGYRVDSKGYVSIYNPDHPNAMCGGYVPEHRLVMSEHIGRPLTDEEEIHHIDRDPDNNEIDNLVLCADHKEHGAYHRR